MREEIDSPGGPMGHPTTPASAPRRMRNAVDTEDGGVGLTTTLSFFFFGAAPASGDGV